MRKPRTTMENLIKKNIEEMMSDPEALNEIEDKLDNKKIIQYEKQSKKTGND